MPIDGSNSNESDAAAALSLSCDRRRRRKRRKKNSKRGSIPKSLILDNSDESEDDGDGENHGEIHPLYLPWSNNLHKEFVEAVFQIGIKKSSPAVIAEQMIHKNSYNTIGSTSGGMNPSSSPEKNTHRHSSDRISISSVLPKENNSAITMAAALTCIGNSEREKDDRSLFQPTNGDESNLSAEFEFYKRELTGERLKSHLQKLRKQRVRETNDFLRDYNLFLARERAIDSEQKQMKKLGRERARKRKQKRRLFHKPSTLLNSSTFDHLDDAERIIASIAGDHGNDDMGIQNKNDDVTKEEEERLLSMYLPIQSMAAQRIRIGSHENFDLKDDVDGTNSSVFPAGGRAIGMVTWAVQQQEIEDAKKKKRQKKQRDRQRFQEVLRQKPEKPPSSLKLPSTKDVSNEWEVASVDSLTSRIVNATENHVGPYESESEINKTKIAQVECVSNEDYSSDDDENSSEEEEDCKISIPSLTDAEKNSPLGVSMRLAWDMIKHMYSVIAEERASKLQRQQQQNMKASRQRQLSRNVDSYDIAGMLPLESESSKAAPSLQHPNTTIDTNPHLLAAIVANGPPPAYLMGALSGATFREKVLTVDSRAGVGVSATLPGTHLKTINSPNINIENGIDESTIPEED